jgi:3-isopropylmalate/(R)-2-methylmalate dehydratase large subunit
MSGQTLYDKLWQAHVVHEEPDGTTLLYIDRHLVHEVTSPQAFEGLRLAGRRPWRADSVLAVPDHNVPTENRDAGIADPVSRTQVETLEHNVAEYGLKFFPMRDLRQGIVHVIGPEQGATLPGTTVVCGDSHTSTHGALGALAFGIGTSEVEHVLATQCLWQKKSRSMLVRVDGELRPGVTAKDVVLAIIGKIGTAGGTGHAIEFGGSAIRGLSIEGRMTICNMAIEAGARAGMVAVDEKTIEYVRGRPQAPSGELFEQAAAAWRELISDPDASFDRVVELDGSAIEPQVSWGTSPEMVVRSPAWCRIRRGNRIPFAPRAYAGPWPTWGSNRVPRSPRSVPTRCSSVPAPTPASRICARPQRWCADGTRPGTSNWPWWCRGPDW